MCHVCGCSGERTAFSKAENVKATSDHLRGTIIDDLESDSATFTESNAQLLKFHGTYQQDDRDRRKEAKAQGRGKHSMMMLRTRIPGGIMSPDAYLAHDDIATRWGNGTVRVTTRQTIQLHGVLKGDLSAAIRTINSALLTTLGGCGDQGRNIMACPEPVHDAFHEDVAAVVAALSEALIASTRAYHEIWIDGVRATAAPEETEALYGDTYLPRKFKAAIALEGDNCVDVYANDLGFVARRERGRLTDFTVLVGGGLGRTANKPNTFPAVGVPFAQVSAEQLVPVARAVVAVYRDWGNRSDRRHARIKYLIADRGIDWLRQRVAEESGLVLPPPRALAWAPVPDHLGWHEQGDTRLYCGLHVENGRIADTPSARLRSTLRRIVEELRPRIVLTPQQNLIIAGVEPSQRALVEQLLSDGGVLPTTEIPLSVRHAMACPALPTCGLAVAESERVMPDLIRRIAAVEAELGLGDERISYRMTGCPNGCARPYLGDVGVVGTTLGKYDIFLGGDFEGTRLNRLFRSNIPLDDIPNLLRVVLAAYRDARHAGETFGDWCYRVGVDALRAQIESVPTQVPA